MGRSLSRTIRRSYRAPYWLKRKIVERRARGLSTEVLADEELEKHFKDNRKMVLYVGIRYDYGQKNWGLSYEHYQFYNTLLNMDYSLIYFDYDRLRSKFGAPKMSQILREAAYLYQPDFLFYFHYTSWVEHAVWQEISDKLPTKTIIMLADDHWRYDESKPVWSLFNLVLTTDVTGFERRQGEGFTNAFLTQWACNHFLYRNLHLPKRYDVSFVGRCYGERKKFVEEIKKKGINVAAFGQGWGTTGRVTQADLIRIYNESKITLNISFASAGGRVQIKGRDFEAVGCGSLLLTKDSKEIAEYFVPDEEIITYKDANDASEKIKYYLENEGERERIARKGFERLMKEHTMEKRLLSILHHAEGVKSN